MIWIYGSVAHNAIIDQRYIFGRLKAKTVNFEEQCSNPEFWNYWRSCKDPSEISCWEKPFIGTWGLKDLMTPGQPWMLTWNLWNNISATPIAQFPMHSWTRYMRIGISGLRSLDIHSIKIFQVLLHYSEIISLIRRFLSSLSLMVFIWWPLNSTWPVSTTIIPDRILSRVVFPEPLGLITATFSPSPICSSGIWSSNVERGYWNFKFLTCIKDL